jgi:hypothetical protein
MKYLPALLCLFVAPTVRAQDTLKSALVFHASFDSGLNADFSTGDPACVLKKGRELAPAALNEEVKLDAAGGKFGGCLHFPKKGATRPQFSGVNMLGYNDKSWNATVSLWLRLTPDEDLEPGYCDPIQIVGDDGKKGFIFLEWSKDETPRFFRYAIRPLQEIWDPKNVGWGEIPFDKRPMVQVARAPFSRDTWTHAVFTLDKVNEPAAAKPAGSLYLNGRLQGRIEGWDLRFAWDPAQVALVLGAAYVGRIDDLAVFNRALGDAEVARLHQLEGGVKSLR